MFQQQRIGHRIDHDPRHDRHVQIGKGVASNQPRLTMVLNMPGAADRAEIEIKPPHQRRTAKSNRKRHGGSTAHFKAKESRSDHNDAFAKCDNNKQGAALGHMAAGNVPVGCCRAAEPGNREHRHRAEVFDPQRQQPPRQPLLIAAQHADRPEHGGNRKPDRDPHHIAGIRRVFTREHRCHAQRPAKLQRDITCREQRRTGGKAFRHRNRHQQAQHHQDQHHQADGEPIGVGPVGCPGGEHPGPPQR